MFTLRWAQHTTQVNARLLIVPSRTPGLVREQIWEAVLGLSVTSE